MNQVKTHLEYSLNLIQIKHEWKKCEFSVLCLMFYTSLHTFFYLNSQADCYTGGSAHSFRDWSNQPHLPICLNRWERSWLVNGGALHLIFTFAHIMDYFWYRIHSFFDQIGDWVWIEFGFVNQRARHNQGLRPRLLRVVDGLATPTEDVRSGAALEITQPIRPKNILTTLSDIHSSSHWWFVFNNKILTIKKRFL